MRTRSNIEDWGHFVPASWHMNSNQLNSIVPCKMLRELIISAPQQIFFFYKNERVTRGKRPLQHVPSVRRPNKNITTLPNQFCFEQAMTENSFAKRRLWLENGTCLSATIKIYGFWPELIFLWSKEINIVKRQWFQNACLKVWVYTISRSVFMLGKTKNELILFWYNRNWPACLDDWLKPSTDVMTSCRRRFLSKTWVIIKIL